MSPIESVRLIGFDIRSDPKTPDAHWNTERRSIFLLRDDIDRPLSVDQNVWPSVIAADDSDQWRGVLGHWSDLNVLSCVAQSQGLVGDLQSCLVSTAIVWNLLSTEEQHQWATERLDQTVPASLGPEWDVVGYDVADQWLVSGLSNCGYVGNERAEWRSRWGERVNAVHLFDDPNEASSFAKATNERVVEHAPFFVYRLLVRSLAAPVADFS